MWIPLGGVILGASDIVVGCGNAVHLAGERSLIQLVFKD
jgi:hypothetical protein